MAEFCIFCFCPNHRWLFAVAFFSFDKKMKEISWETSIFIYKNKKCVWLLGNELLGNEIAKIGQMFTMC